MRQQLHVRRGFALQSFHCTSTNYSKKELMSFFAPLITFLDGAKGCMDNLYMYITRTCRLNGDSIYKYDYLVLTKKRQKMWVFFAYHNYNYTETDI